MLHYLANYEHIWGPLRLFRYLTFRAALAMTTSLVTGFFIAPQLLRLLKRWKLHQVLRQSSEVRGLASLHADKKSTPTMGGFMIFIPVMITTVLFAKLNPYVLSALLVYSGLTLIGFLDDFLKISRNDSHGLPSKWKLSGQALVTLGALGILLSNPKIHVKMVQLWVPFLKFPLIETMPLWFLFIFLFLIISGSSNGINLTDGIDGLAIGCTIVVALVYSIMAYVAGNKIIADYLFLSHVPKVGELAILCFSLIGSSLVFLWYNAYPAEVFMGDTGSLALGGVIGAIAFMTHQPFTLIIVGGVFVMEATSVILQVASFRLRKKRIFKMSPIHHHFELKGWPETKVVIRFWILSLLFGLAGLATLKLR
jgi:phospho-N-acetylmuramoyl-pentapeptide-transferase